MGGGVAGGELAGAVSAAGGLGTVGTVPSASLRRELARARDLAGDRPLAVNLLLPFIDDDHVDVVREARPEVAVLFFGNDRHLVEALHDAGCFVLQQVGTVPEAQRALRDGVDGLIAQGRDAGGHLLGTTSTLDAVARIVAASSGCPVLGAGGIVDHGDVRTMLDAGAAAAVAGTRFLLTPEARAHAGYKDRVCAATRTVETELFGFGWPRARHRVVPNAATDRWEEGAGGAAAAVEILNRATGPIARRLPMELAARLVSTQRPWLPVFSPQPALPGMPERLLNASPLYAGESARRIDRLVPAADVVARLTGSLPPA